MVIGDNDRDLLVQYKFEIQRMKEDLEEAFKEVKFYGDRTNELQSSHNTIIYRLNDIEDKFECFEEDLTKKIDEIHKQFTDLSTKVGSFMLFVKISAGSTTLIVAILATIAAFLQIK